LEKGNVTALFCIARLEDPDVVGGGGVVERASSMDGWEQGFDEIEGRHPQMWLAEVRDYQNKSRQRVITVLLPEGKKDQKNREKNRDHILGKSRANKKIRKRERELSCPTEECNTNAFLNDLDILARLGA